MIRAGRKKYKIAILGVYSDFGRVCVGAHTNYAPNPLAKTNIYIYFCAESHNQNQKNAHTTRHGIT